MFALLMRLTAHTYFGGSGGGGGGGGGGGRALEGQKNRFFYNLPNLSQIYRRIYFLSFRGQFKVCPKIYKPKRCGIEQVYERSAPLERALLPSLF